MIFMGKKKVQSLQCKKLFINCCVNLLLNYFFRMLFCRFKYYLLEFEFEFIKILKYMQLKKIDYN